MRKPTWRKPLVITNPRTYETWSVYFANESVDPHTYSISAYERGNYAACDIHIKMKNAWDWFCGFIAYLFGRRM